MGRATVGTLVASIVLLIGTQPGRAEEPSLGTPITDPAEIVGHMAGNTLSGIVMETGAPWAEYYCDNGRSLYAFGVIALGKWWTRDGKVCFAYEYNEYQFPRCFEMYGKPDGSLAFFAYDDAGQPMTFISKPPVPGDPFRLEQRAVNGCALEPSV